MVVVNNHQQQQRCRFFLQYHLHHHTTPRVCFFISIKVELTVFSIPDIHLTTSINGTVDHSMSESSIIRDAVPRVELEDILYDEDEM